MYSFFAKYFSSVIYYLSRGFPKFNWAIIQTYPIWEDSGIRIHNELSRSRINKIIWLTPEAPPSETIRIKSDKTIFVKRRSLKAIFYYIFSRYIFLTHGLYSRKFPSNQISVNIWHGMPIKKIGLLDGREGLKTTYTLSTSSYFNKVISESFGVLESTVLSIGLPRNERLLQVNNIVKVKLGIPTGNKFLFWLPTYRKSKEGDVRVDGKVFNNPFHLPGFDAEEFNSFLIENRITCFFKPHPMAEIHEMEDYSNLRIINEDFLQQKELTLYETLGKSDFLISDISSIVVDYLLVDKPIILSFADKTEYLNSRGLNFTDIIENPPGRICSNISEIKEELRRLLHGDDSFIDKRAHYLKRYHGDGNPEKCTENLLQVIDLL